MTKKAQRPKSKAFVVIKAESGGSTTSIADDNEKRLNQNTIWGMGWGPKHLLTTFLVDYILVSTQIRRITNTNLLF